MVSGMIAGFTDYNFINACTSLELDGNKAITVREIDGGNETIATSLPLIVGGQKGLVEESELKIPNMRGIMMARKKPLQVVEPADSSDKTSILSFEKPAEKSAVKLIDADNIDELISLLHNEATRI
jgi:electron transfer flavoprotein beta subunit